MMTKGIQRDNGRRLWVLLLAVCCLWAGLAGGDGHAAAEESSYGCYVENDILYLSEGVQVIGYLPEEMAEEAAGLTQSSVLETYFMDYFFQPEDMNQRIEEIVLPDSLLYIGEGAFYAVSADKLVWPEKVSCILDRSLSGLRVAQLYLHAGVTEYSRYSFCGCEGVSAFFVEEGNPALKAVDGVLFSADGRTLLRYPPQRAGEHYDVPFGVEAIAPYAFSGCQQLRSVTLPMGVRSIGWSAFGECVLLESVAVPLTLREMEPYAFLDCISLRSIQLPEAVQVVCEPEILAERNSWEGEPWKPEEYVFWNTPLLADYAAWDRLKVEAANAPQDTAAEYDGGTPPEDVTPRIRYAVLNPENARDLVKIYLLPEEDSQVLGKFECGSTVTMLDHQDGWYQVGWRRDQDEGGHEGWVRAENVLLYGSGEPLFEIASVRPKNSSVYYLTNGTCVLPYDQPRVRVSGEERLSFGEMQGQWAMVMREDGQWGWGYCYFYPSDLIYTRKHTGDDLRFGIVISDDPRDRLNLRIEPQKGSKSIGKYFSGTQVQILEEKGDWYKVRVDFQDGWMMKEFVQEVPQAVE